MAPLNIDWAIFDEGLDLVERAIKQALDASSGEPTSQSATSERYEAAFDRHDHGGDTIARPELAHAVAKVEFHGLL